MSKKSKKEARKSGKGKAPTRKEPIEPKELGPEDLDKVAGGQRAGGQPGPCRLGETNCDHLYGGPIGEREHNLCVIC